MRVFCVFINEFPTLGLKSIKKGIVCLRADFGPNETLAHNGFRRFIPLKISANN